MGLRTPLKAEGRGLVPQAHCRLSGGFSAERRGQQLIFLSSPGVLVWFGAVLLTAVL